MVVLKHLLFLKLLAIADMIAQASGESEQLPCPVNSSLHLVGRFYERELEFNSSFAKKVAFNLKTDFENVT